MYIREAAERITEEALKNSSAKIFPKGSVGIAMYGATIGKLSIWGMDASTNQACAVGIPTEAINNEFLYYFLLAEKQKLIKAGKGGAQPNISQGIVKEWPINLPPIPEQHRIVVKIEELFSELDKGVENLKAARAQLKVYRQALLKHAFEGKLTAQWRAENQGKLETAEALLKRIQQERAERYQQQLADWEKSPSIPLLQRGKTTTGTASIPPFVKGGLGGISKPKAPKPLPPLTAEELAELPELPEGWIYAYLSDLGDLGRGKSKHRPRNDPRLFGGIYPFVQTGEVKAANRIIRRFSQTLSDFGLQQSKLWPTGTLCITIAANIAETAFLGFDGCFPDSVVGFSAFKKIIAPEYVDFFIQAARTRIEAYAPATAQKNINLETLENLVVPYCCPVEQKLILDILEERFSIVEQLDQTIAASLQQAEALRQSILKKAFSGQLVEQDASDEPASVLLARIKAEKAAQMMTAKPRKSQKTQRRSVPVKLNVISFPVKIANISTTDLHAGILARAYQYHEQNPKHLIHFGHVKVEKISHLVETHLGIDLERLPVKDAAGPNDYPHLKKVESRARKANWFDVHQQKAGGAYVFNKKHGFDALLDKTTNALGERIVEVDALIRLLLPLNTKQAEIVATLYAAWNNLLMLGHAPSDEDIVYEAREDWHTSKLNIEREKFFNGLEWMRKQSLVPTGKGRYVAKKGEQSKSGEVKHD